MRTPFSHVQLLQRPSHGVGMSHLATTRPRFSERTDSRSPLSAKRNRRLADTRPSVRVATAERSSRGSQRTRLTGEQDRLDYHAASARKRISSLGHLRRCRAG